MNQTAEAIKTNKVVIRIKVASDSVENVAKVESNNKSSGLLWLIASVVCLALAIWYWSSQQGEKSSDSVESVASINTDAPVITAPFVNEVSLPPPVVISDLPQNLPPVIPIVNVDETPKIPVVSSTEVIEEKHQSDKPAVASVSVTPEVVVAGQEPQKLIAAPAKAEDSTKHTVSDVNQSSSKFVARALFALEIKNREPVNKIDSQVEAKKAGLKRIYFFSELRGLKGKTVIHRWLYKGKKQGEVVFDVSGNHWRVNSNKHIRTDQLGTWQVDIVTVDNNQVLMSRSFNYGTPE